MIITYEKRTGLFKVLKCRLDYGYVSDYELALKEIKKFLELVMKNEIKSIKK